MRVFIHRHFGSMRWQDWILGAALFFYIATALLCAVGAVLFVLRGFP